MPLTALLALALVPTQSTKTFRDGELGLTFQYPSAWTLKKGRHSTDLTFTAADGTTAEIQIFKMQFRQEKSVWQQLQRQVSEQMNRRVTRQWEEQILGVPLLLTRIDYADGEAQKSTLVGLLYTATYEKLNFRVNSSLGASDEVETAWRKALMTLGTTNGELPQPEDPTKPVANPNQTPTGRPIARLTPDGNTEPVRTKNVVKLEKLGQTLDLYLPEGWTVKHDEQRMFLTLEKLTGTVELMLSPGGRQQVAGVLRTANDSSFDTFTLVTLRDDPVPGVKKSGVFVASTLRIGGTQSGGQAVAWHAVGSSGTVVWRIDYTNTSEEGYRADKKLIERLIEYTAIEIVR